MNPLTLFDLVSNEVIWYGNFCAHCFAGLPSKKEIGNNELVVRLYNNSDDQLVCIVYHVDCWYNWMTDLKSLGAEFK